MQNCLKTSMSLVSESQHGSSGLDLEKAAYSLQLLVRTHARDRPVPVENGAGCNVGMVEPRSVIRSMFASA